MSTPQLRFVGRLLAGAALLFSGALALAQTTTEYSALVGTAGSTGFQQLNAPGSSAVRGEPGVTTIRTSHDGLSQDKVKIFVPPGTMRWKVSMVTYRVDQDARAAARFGSTPVSTFGDILPGTAISDQRQSLRKLLAGEELKFYSPGNSGVLSIAGSESTDVTPSATGGYIYLNFLSVPGSQIYSFQTYLDVQSDCYSNWYANARWDASGNPLEGASHTCSGSTGGGTGTGGTDTGGGAGGPFSFTPASLIVGSVESTTITPAAGVSLPTSCTASSAYVGINGRNVTLTWQKGSIKAATEVTISCGNYSSKLTLYPAGASTGGAALTGIALSTDTLAVGGSPSSIAIQAQPSTAALPQCTASNSSYLTVSGAKITLGSAAAALTSTRTEKVTCGAFEKTITIKPAGSVATVSTEVVTAIDGKLTLRLTLKQPSADVPTGTTTNIWVAAYLPEGAVFANEAVWFFKTPTSWSEIDSININSLAFARNQAAGVQKVFEVPLGLSASDMRPFSIEIYFGYANSNGVFVNLGKVWSGNN